MKKVRKPLLYLLLLLAVVNYKGMAQANITLNSDIIIVDSTNISSNWPWQQRYIIWEADRKVFLYPENWIEPDLSGDVHSTFFQQNEQALIQNDITSVREAYRVWKDDGQVFLYTLDPSSGRVEYNNGQSGLLPPSPPSSDFVANYDYCANLGDGCIAIAIPIAIDGGDHNFLAISIYFDQNHNPLEFLIENGINSFYYTQAVPAPEPSTFLLLGAGLIGVGLLRRKKK